MKYRDKLILCIIGCFVFVLSPIITFYFTENTSSPIFIIICVLSGFAAFIDAFVFMLPYFFSYKAIKSSNINPNKYSYKRRLFVDRKLVYKNIKTQIKSLDKSNENTIWIKLCGTDGIGKKALTSKLFYNFHYPLNKFFFINNNTATNNLQECIVEKYSLNNETNEKFFYNNLKALKRTFIIIPFDNANMNTSIVGFMSAWMHNIQHNKKLIIISLDSKQSTKNTNRNNTYLFEFEIKQLTTDYSKELINKIVTKIPDEDVDKIATISKGNPEHIKYLCDKYKEIPDGILITERLDMELRMSENVKKEFFKLCIYTIADKKVPEYTIKNDIKQNLYVTKKIIIENCNIYVSEWLLNALIISNKYFNDFENAINMLVKQNLITKEECLIAKAIVFKKSEDILNILNVLERKKDYKFIKNMFIKTYYSMKCNSNKEKKQILCKFARVLLLLGEYDLICNPLLTEKTILLNNSSNEDKELTYLCADYYHLTSDYNNSNILFELLLEITKDPNYKLQLQFNIAHNYRHSGELKTAIEKFESILKLANKDSDLYVRSLTSIKSIEYFNIGYQNSLIKDLANIHCTSDARYNIIRHIISIQRRKKETLDNAIDLCLKTIKELEHINLRIIYDYYFELAECYRTKYAYGDDFYYSESLTFYNKSHMFAEMNSDINLRLNSIIGKSFLEYIHNKNAKKLYKQMTALLNTSKQVSKLIYYSILTITNIINDSNYYEKFDEEQFGYYNEIMVSKNLDFFHLTVM